MMTTFGEYIHSLRMKKRISLREFSRKSNIDASNWSKIEKGSALPPKSIEILTAIIQVLGLDFDSEEANTLRELAVIGAIPTGLLSSQDILEKLPVFFRTARGEKPDEADLKELVTILTKSD